MSDDLFTEPSDPPSDRVSDDELERRLAGVRHELRSQHPRPDPRIEAILDDRQEPTIRLVPPADIDVTDPVPITRAGRRERAGVVAAVAATLLLFVTAGAVAFNRADGPSLDAILEPATDPPEDAPEPGETDPPEDTDPEPETDTAEDTDPEPETDTAEEPHEFFSEKFFGDDFEAHREWLVCVTDGFSASLHDGFETPFTTDDCGPFPPLPDFEFETDLRPKLEEWLGCVELDAPEGPLAACIDRGLEVFPFHGLGPDRFDEACETEETEGGFGLHCVWPPCDPTADCLVPPCPDGATGDDTTTDGCLAFDLDFGFELGDLSTLPGLPDDFEFPWKGEGWSWDPDHEPDGAA